MSRYKPDVHYQFGPWHRFGFGPWYRSWFAAHEKKLNSLRADRFPE